MSIFNRKLEDKPDSSPYSPNLIEKEIAHLKGGSSTRSSAKDKKTMATLICFVLVCALLWLFFMDPVLHSYYKGEAIQAYLYLHNYGNDKDATALQTCGMLSESDVTTLSRQSGQYLKYFTGPKAASDKVAEIVAYMSQVRSLHASHTEKLDTINKIRCVLFVHDPVSPPTQWDFLDPAVTSGT